MKLKLFLIFLFFSGVNTFHAQTADVKWEPLLINNNNRVWFDIISIDSSKGAVLNVWILQMHKPPLEFDELPQKVYRTKTEYCIDFKLDKYGIKKAAYYGSKNDLLFNFDYHLEKYPDSLKFTYPVKDNFFINLLVQKIGDKEQEKK